jgi:2-oxo-3-hexenedioate decarboxylase
MPDNQPVAGIVVATQNKMLDVHAIAEEVIASLSSHAQIPTFSSRPEGLTLAQAYQVTPLLRAAFEARGETITGRKIGFTNREMWKAYGVDSPIWGYATSRTTRALEDTQIMPLRDFSEPRIEPEIMFGLATAPTRTMNDSELLECIEWVALGYEIVQSIFPHWKFTAADAVAANCVHGALLIGKRHAVAPRKRDWQSELATFEVELYRGDEMAQCGGGALVLGSPLAALRHLIELLADDPHNAPLRAGETISTGTLTLAMPIKPGERWATRLRGIALEDIAIKFGADP